MKEQQDGMPEGTEASTEVSSVKPLPEKVVSRSWLWDIVVSIVISALIIIFLYQPVRVEGTSMLPMLEDQDRLFINKMAYRVGEIHRGDVVVFFYPRDHSKSYISGSSRCPGMTSASIMARSS